MSAQDLIQGALWVPLWWYTKGFRSYAALFFSPLGTVSRSLSLSVLAENLVQPLFGDATRSGRLVSVPVRLGHFLALLSLLGLVGAALTLAYVLWMLLPLLALFHIGRIGIALFLPS